MVQARLASYHCFRKKQLLIAIIDLTLAYIPSIPVMTFATKNILQNPKPVNIVFLLLVVIFYLFMAYKSSGYIQEDEHFQIIEFANYKLGLVSVNKLAWEFNAQIRPGLQPLICYLIFKVCHALGIDDGYNLAFILRALTGLFSSYVLYVFVLTYKKYVSAQLKNTFIAASFLLWFLPYINIRFSSENLSGLMLMSSLVLLDQSNYCEKRNKTVFMGIVLGLAILFRYQSLLFVAGLFLWLLLVRKRSIINILRLSFGILTVLIIGVLIDFWLYGAWGFTLFNYFDANIIKGIASNFGTSPFYQYFLYILQALGIFGLLILVSFCLICYYYSKNIIVWVCIPFLLVHSLIPHKELRFLFTLANLCPLILILGFQKASLLISKASGNTKLKMGSIIFALLSIVNIFGLVAVSSTGAGNGRVVVAEYIHRHYDQKKLKITLIGKVYPFIDWQGIQNTFYSSVGFKQNHAVNIWQEDLVYNDVSRNRRHIYIIKAKEIAGPKELEYLKSIGLRKVYQSIPDFTFFLYGFYNKDLKDRQTYVFEANVID